MDMLPPTRSGHLPAERGLPLGRRRAPRRQPAGFVHAPQPSAAGALLRDASEQHVLVIAPTGAGKGRSVLIPWLLSHDGAAIVVDPKGEAAAVTARWRRGIGQQVCVIDPWSVLGPAVQAQALNPLQALLDDSTELGDDCLTLAELIVGEAPVSLQDPFWRALAMNLIAALIGWVWVRAQVTAQDGADDRTLGGVWALLHHDDLTYLLAATLDKHGSHAAMPAFVREGFVTFLNHEADKVRTSVRSEAVSLLRVFASPRVQAATARTTLPLALLREGGPCSVYLVVPPDRLDSHSAYVRIVLGTLLALMARRTARPDRPTLFCVDELAHLGAMPPLRQAVTLLRGYGVRVALFVQSLAQLKALWPRDHETIAENCGLWLNFGNTSLAAARQVADQLGDVSADMLFQMGADGIAIHRAGEPTEVAQRLDYLADEACAARYEPNPYHHRGGAGGGSGRSAGP